MGNLNTKLENFFFSSECDYHLSSVMVSLGGFAACMVSLEVSIGAKKTYNRCMEDLLMCSEEPVQNKK